MRTDTEIEERVAAGLAEVLDWPQINLAIAKELVIAARRSAEDQAHKVAGIETGRMFLNVRSKSKREDLLNQERALLRVLDANLAEAQAEEARIANEGGGT